MVSNAHFAAHDILSLTKDSSRLLECSHILNNDSIQWQDDQRVIITQLQDYATHGARLHAYTFEKAGSGTHMDSPAHFCEGKKSIEQIALTDLISPLCVVDIRQQVAAAGADYGMSDRDVLNYEKIHGKIPDGAVVVGYSGWDEQHWASGAKAYRNQDEKGIRHFPGFAESAAKLLVERNVHGIGIDTLSTDPGADESFATHHTILGANKYQLECLANVHKMPARGATMIALPLLVQGGSESPTRVMVIT